MLVITTLFVFAFPVYAVDGLGDIDIDDCTVNGFVSQTENETTTQVNVTNQMTITDINSGTWAGMRSFAFPLENPQQDGIDRNSVRIRVLHGFDIRADHEYKLQFKWGYNANKQATFKVEIRYLDANRNIVKTQTIYNVTSPGQGKVHSFDLNFKAYPPEGQEGYKCDLYIEFFQEPQNSLITSKQTFYFSQQFSFVDLDDNSQQLDGILGAILSIPEKIKGFFLDLGNTILDGIKNLFIPDEEYLETKKVELETFCVEHFGAVYQSLDVFIEFLTSLISISPTEPKITFPAIDVPVLGTTYHLTDAVEYSFAWVNDSSHFLYYFYNFYRGFVTVLLFLSFVNYCRNKYAEIFGG